MFYAVWASRLRDTWWSKLCDIMASTLCPVSKFWQSSCPDFPQIWSVSFELFDEINPFLRKFLSVLVSNNSNWKITKTKIFYRKPFSKVLKEQMSLENSFDATNQEWPIINNNKLHIRCIPHRVWVCQGHLNALFDLIMVIIPNLQVTAIS